MTQVRTDRLLELADIIEAGEPRENIQGWNMAAFMAGAECGTAGCIGGWACAVYAPDEFRPTAAIDIVAQRVLGLSNQQAMDLFYGVWSEKCPDIKNITRHEAAAELRRLAAEHGEGVG